MSRETTGVNGDMLENEVKDSMTNEEEQTESYQILKMGDVKTRILSFLLDAIFMFWPSLIFIISMLLLTSPANIGGNIISNTWELTMVYIISIFCFNTVSALYWEGQTLGMRYFQLKIVKSDLQKASRNTILCRELIGVSLPWALIMLSYNIIGFTAFIISFFAFLVVNLLFIIADKQHRSLIDLPLGTKIVYVELTEDTQDLLHEEIEETILSETESIEEHAEQPVSIADDKEAEPVMTVSADADETMDKVEKDEVEHPVQIDEKDQADNPPAVETEKQKPQADIEQPAAKPIAKKPDKKVKTKKEDIKEEPQKEMTEKKPAAPKEKKEKSVTEIISEAVSVVDEALQPKKEIPPIVIEKPKKKQEEKPAQTETIQEEVSNAQETVTETVVSETQPVKKPAGKKNQKKKNKGGNKQAAKKNTVNMKQIKPASNSRKPAKKS